MCGISGIVARQQPVAGLLEAVRTMGLYQHHRGPDGWGEWSGEGVALGHNRLAILDLAGGAQPMSCAAGGHVIVFNGEIYNFRDIRKDVLAAGGMLRTDHSDTEAIVEGFRLWGDDLFRRLDGMFACAIWSVATRQLTLARDRAGIKPLYYCYGGPGRLAFASEPKALVGSGAIVARFNSAALPEYFLWRAALQPWTMFEGIQSLEPGTRLRYDVASGTHLIDRFVASPTCVTGDKRAGDVAELRDRIDRAVQSQLVADVEVGSFLSGGVDSSIITALAARSTRLRAFTVSTPGPLDELQYARRVADHVGAGLDARAVTPDDMLAAVDDWSYFNDDPVADPSALALMLLAREARASGLKVMLSGEGADELFGGYRAYARFLAVRAVTDRIGDIATSMNRFGDTATREYLAESAAPYWGTAHVSTEQMRRALLGPAADGMRARLTEASAGLGRLRAAMALDQRFRLPSDVLMRTDRATMASSLEARVPMLANDVVAASWQLADRDLFRPFPPANKPLLKQLAAGLVPREVVYRRKVGFDLPVAHWLRGRLRERVTTMIDARLLPGLEYGTVSGWYARLGQGEHRLAAVLWAWFVLESWYRRWILQPTRPMAAALGPSQRAVPEVARHDASTRSASVV